MSENSLSSNEEYLEFRKTCVVCRKSKAIDDNFRRSPPVQYTPIPIDAYIQLGDGILGVDHGVGIGISKIIPIQHTFEVTLEPDLANWLATLEHAISQYWLESFQEETDSPEESMDFVRIRKRH